MASRDPAPGALALVQRFVNTADLEGGEDRLRDPAGLRAWLAEEGLLAGAPVGAAACRHALELREALRALAAANAGHGRAGEARAVVDAAARRARLEPRLLDGASTLEPRTGGVPGALGRVVAAVHAAVAAGTWPRLKACERGTCRWVFYDHSRNASGRWCDMAVCGSREKSRRAYRRRQAAGP